MTLPEHAICSFMLAQFGVRQKYGVKGVAVVTLAGIAPDIDTAAKLVSDRYFWELHHALGHNIFALVLLAAVMAGIGRWMFGLRPYYYLFTWCLIAASVHALTDCLYWFPVKPFWPLSDWEVGFNVLEYLDLFVLAIWLSGAICLFKLPTKAPWIAATTLLIFTAYVSARAALPVPTGIWKFLTGGWMYEAPQGTPVLDWW